MWFYKILGKWYFSSNAISLKDYINNYSNTQFEIITKGYFWNNTTYTGWIKKQHRLHQPLFVFKTVAICYIGLMNNLIEGNLPWKNI